MTRKIEEQFGYEWDLYREIIPDHKQQFIGWITPLSLDFFKDKRFLDAGCGIGRNSLWPLQAGAKSAVVFDFDPRTVNVARENLKGFSNCEVAKDSIYHIPFENEFDVVFCIGVLHHLEKPVEALRNLVKSLKKGGTLILWVYAKEGNESYLRFFDPFRKFVTSRIHPRFTRWISIFLTILLKAYIRLPQSSPYLKILRTRGFRHVEAMVFDQLIPVISNYWTRDEVMNLIGQFPLQLESLTHTHKMSWSVVAEKI